MQKKINRWLQKHKWLIRQNINKDLGQSNYILEEKIEVDKKLGTNQSVSSLQMDLLHMVSPAR